MTDTSTQFDSHVLAERYDQTSTSQFENGVQLVQALGIRRGDRILDVGCGTGRLIEHLLTTFGDAVDLVGLDPSPYRITIARQKVAASPAVTFLRGSDRDLQAFADCSFDCVYLNAVFHHIQSIEAKAAALLHIQRILKPGGRLGISDPDKEVPGLFREITKEVVESHGLHYADENLVSRTSMRSLLVSSGFDILRLDQITKTRSYPTPQAALAFSEASNFGKYLSDMPDDLREQIKSEIGERLRAFATETGIEHSLGRIFVIARKKAQ